MAGRTSVRPDTWVDVSLDIGDQVTVTYVDSDGCTLWGTELVVPGIWDGTGEGMRPSAGRWQAEDMLGWLSDRGHVTWFGPWERCEPDDHDDEHPKTVRVVGPGEPGPALTGTSDLP